MELTFQLLDTLQSLDNKGMHKFADRLSNTMIKLAQETTTPEKYFKNLFDKKTQNMLLSQKLDFLENQLKLTPQLSANSKLIIEDLIKEYDEFPFKSFSTEKYFRDVLKTNTNLSKAFTNSGITLVSDSLLQYYKLNKLFEGSIDEQLTLLNADVRLNPGLKSQLGPVFEEIAKNLKSSDFLNQSLDDQLRSLINLSNSYPSLNDQINPILKEIAKDPDFDITKLRSIGQDKSFEGFKSLEDAAQKSGFIKPKKLVGEIGKETFELGDIAAKGAKSKEAAEAGIEVLEKVATKLPILKSVLPMLGKAFAILGFIPALMGIIGDFNKHGMKIFDDSELTMKFGQNLIELVIAAASLFPPLTLVLIPIQFALNALFDNKRAEIKKEEKKSWEKFITDVKPRIENYIKTNPNAKLIEVIENIEPYVQIPKLFSLENKEKFEKFKYEDLPTMVKELKEKNKPYNPYEPSVKPQKFEPGTVTAIPYRNSQKNKNIKIANNNENRTVIADTIKAARELEKEGYYMEADLANRMALELTKITL